MKSSGRTKGEIVDVATRLFAKYGFRKTSIDVVAAAARIGKGSVYLHFASKEDLFGAVVREVSDRTLDALVAAVEGAGSPADEVRAFLEARRAAFARFAEEHRLDDETMLELLVAARPHRQPHDDAELALLARLLRDGNACGAFAVADPERVATGLLASLTALATTTVVKRDDEAVRAGVTALVEVVVRGLASPPSCNPNPEERTAP